jgi:hypothetical protein
MFSTSGKINLTFVLVLLISATLTAQVSFKLSTHQSIGERVQPDSIALEYNGKKKAGFLTLTSIEYDRVMTKLQPLKKRRDALMTELETNSQDTAHLYTDEVYRRKQDSIVLLDQLISAMDEQSDSLFYECMRERVDYDKCTVFPDLLRARAVFDIVYGTNRQRFRAMGNSGVQFGGNGTASIYSEVVSGNLGLIRVGFGTMLTSDDSGNDSTAQTDQAYQRLVTNGGNTILTLEYPLLYANGFNDQLNTIVRPIVKGTADLPAFGTSTDKWAGSLMFGLDVYADAALDNNQLRFFANMSTFYIRGTSVYQSNLAIASPDFSFGQLTLGLVFLENFKISIIVATWSTQAILRDRKAVIGGQVLR